MKQVKRHFSDILKENNINLEIEYSRVYALFENETCLKDYCENDFERFPFAGTCISLNDFDCTHDFYFEECPEDFDIDYLVLYCEYTYNLVKNILDSRDSDVIRFVRHIDTLIEKIGYMPIRYKDDSRLTLFVPKSNPAIVVAQIVSKPISYKVIEYNHHSLKGNLKGKAEILKALADQLEPQKDDLESIDKQIKSDLFYLFNNLNIRHNNEDKIQNISEEELEEWYDYTYDMSLIAFMILDKKDHKNEILELKKKLGDL